MSYNKSTVVIAALAFGATTTVASAVITETASDRYVLVDANASSDIGNVMQSDGPVIFGEWTDDISVAASGGGGNGQGYAYQSTITGPGSYSGTVEAIASAQPDDFGFDLYDGYGQSHYEVSFTVTGTIDFDLFGDGGGFGTVNGAWSSDSYVAIESITGGTPTQVFLDEDNAYTNFAGSGTLLAGDYKFVVDSTVGVQFIFESGPYIEGNASVNWNLTFTPTPGPVALFGVAGAFASRRRR